MAASMLVMAISFTWDGGQHVGDCHQFYLGWWPARLYWASVLPGMVVNMLLFAIIFTWDCGQHVGDGHQFYLGWWPACW
jgi:hypothetical protein